MNDKQWGLLFIIGAVAYFIFTAIVLQHGIHFTNSIVAAGGALVSIHFYVNKKR